MSEHGEAKHPAFSGCTCLRLRKASRRVSQIYDQYLQRHGLTITQYSLLAHLNRLDGVSIGALAEKLIMDPTTLTRNLRPLERQELIRLAADPRDRRSRRLRLTDQGRALLTEARPAWIEAQRHIEDTLGPSAAPALHAALDHMLERLAS
jgi:DNA-binding MarR family transcriptional regulator